MSKHLLKFYPVDNGDTTLITLMDNTTVLVDYKIRECEENSSGVVVFDVKKDLLSSIQKRNNIPFVDVFMVTHPDEDHCLGFENNFYCGNPSEYAEANRKNGEIMVDELWCTSMVFNCVTNDDAKSLRKEAERRRKLWDKNDADKNMPGNRIRMIGYDGDQRFNNVPNSVPGDTINVLNGKVKTDFEFFVHAPFKKDLIIATSEEDQNFSSIVMQARFKISASDMSWACFFLFGGDADHYIWAEVLNKSMAHGNTEKLKWDILLAPHHCSWTFFNDVPYSAKDENKTPKETSLKILDYKRPGSKVIASCKVIKNNDDNPPHYQAKIQYTNKVTDSGFLNTAVEPDEKKPEPIIFEIGFGGITRKSFGLTTEEKLAGASVLAGRSIVSGNWC